MFQQIKCQILTLSKLNYIQYYFSHQDRKSKIYIQIIIINHLY
ncbi:hypothetical protein pb186bvf_009121 [Paramecium bursaria]